MVVNYLAPPWQTLATFQSSLGHNVAIPDKTARAIFKRVVATLQFILDTGMVHLDMHMGNIMVRIADKKLDVKVIDFGSAEPITRQFLNLEMRRLGK
jgi:predicted unusual protein kinase regulating ubiquinone biosynthesis (AarF/ABC1/UbiB family)